MFRVFSKFSALFFRPRIKGAIQEYQSLLIQSVKDDIQRLQNKFRETYESTQACKVAVVRDIPPIAGKVIWAKQLQRRLDIYIKRVEEVLGPSCGRDWEKNPEGQKLKQECDAFAKSLNTNEIWEKWLKDNNIKDNKSFDVGTKIFEITSGSDGMELVVNFDAHTTTLFKEVRHFQSLQCRVPYSVKVTSDEAKLNYPFATTLRESVRTYVSTCANITPRIAPIIAWHQNMVQRQIEDGLQLKWDSEPLRVESYIRKLSDQDKVGSIYFFQDKVAELL
jgi:dynein heavy chain 1